MLVVTAARGRLQKLGSVGQGHADVVLADRHADVVDLNRVGVIAVLECVAPGLNSTWTIVRLVTWTVTRFDAIVRVLPACVELVDVGNVRLSPANW